jgi:hypothetical protein
MCCIACHRRLLFFSLIPTNSTTHIVISTPFHPFFSFINSIKHNHPHCPWHVFPIPPIWLTFSLVVAELRRGVDGPALPLYACPHLVTPHSSGPMSLQPLILAPLSGFQPPQGHVGPPPIPGTYPHPPSAPHAAVAQYPCDRSFQCTFQTPQGHAGPLPMPGAYPHTPSPPAQHQLNVPAPSHSSAGPLPMPGAYPHSSSLPVSTSSISLPPVIPAPVARILSPVGTLDHCDARHVSPPTQVPPCSSGPMSLGHAGPLPIPGCIPTYLVPPCSSGSTSLLPAPVARVLSPAGARQATATPGM